MEGGGAAEGGKGWGGGGGGMMNDFWTAPMTPGSRSLSNET